MVFTVLMSVLKGLADLERLLSLLTVDCVEDHVALDFFFSLNLGKNTKHVFIYF